MALSARCDAVLLHWLSNLPFKLKESMEDSRLLKSASQAYLLRCVTTWGQTQSQASKNHPAKGLVMYVYRLFYRQ